MLRRGEIWLANLDPPCGSKPGKTRPVLLVQCQTLLDVGHPSTLVVPLTTRLVEDAEPLRIRVPVSGRLSRESDVLIDQLRAIDNRRLTRGPVARLAAPLLAKVDAAIREVLDLAESQTSLF